MQGTGGVDRSFAAAGSVSGGSNVGGLIGRNTVTSSTAFTRPYCDTDLTTPCVGGSSNTNVGHLSDAGKTTSEIQTPVSATGIYSQWTITGLGEPWDFGTRTQYPALDHSSLEPDEQRPPAVPAGISATAGDSRVHLAWDDGTGTNATITHYEVRHTDDTDAWLETWTVVSGGAAATRHSVTGLTNDTEYSFELRAVNEVGAGAPATISATPEAGIVSSDATATIALADSGGTLTLTAVVSPPASVTGAWITSVASGITSVTVTVTPADSVATFSIAATADDGTTTLTVVQNTGVVSGLTPGDNTITVTAEDTTTTETYTVTVFRAIDLDIDGDGEVSLQTDGILLLRHIIGTYSGVNLTRNAVDTTNGTRTTAAQITAYLDRITGAGGN